MAFPENGVLDTFPADGGPPPNANWSGPIWIGDNQLRVVSGFLGPDVAPGGENYWNSSFGADQEAYITVFTLPPVNSGMALYLRVQSPNTGSETFIQAIYKRLAGTDTITVNLGQDETLQLTVNQEIAAGDSYGASVVGTTVTVYYKASAGSWGSVGSVDIGASPSGAGYIGVGFGSGATGMETDSFGGGTVSIGVVNLLNGKFGGLLEGKL